MNWKAKALFYRVLAVLPFGDQLHYQSQRLVTRTWPRQESALDGLATAAHWICSHAEGRRRFLEIGSGRDLAVPIALRMLGAESVTTVDVSRLARLDLVNHAARYMGSRFNMQAPRLRSWSEVRDFGIEYLAPSGLERLEGRSFDCFVSVDTLEHIPIDHLRAVLRLARSLLAPGGRSIHIIDYSDHFARDAGVSRFNFLRYDDTKWAAYSCRFNFVNRLRHSEMLSEFDRAGYAVTEAISERMAPIPDILNDLASKFRHFDHQDLFTLRARLVARVPRQPFLEASCNG